MKSKLYINISITLIIILLSVLGAACSSREAVRELQSIERIIPEKPDSALSVLEKNSILAEKGREAKALYSLLLTEARYKTAIRDTADSLIRPAVEYYGMSDDDRHRAKTFFMAGNLDFNAGEYGEAVINCLRAEKSAMQAGDHLMLGLIYRLIADSFEKVMDWESALHYHKLSLNHFNRDANNRYLDYAMIDVARGYYCMAAHDSVMKYADMAYKKGVLNNDTYLTTAALRIHGKSYLDRHDYKNTISNYEKLHDVDSTMMLSEDYRNLGIAYIGTNDMDKAKICQSRLERIDSSDKMLSFEINRYIGNYKNALESLEYEITNEEKEISKLWNRNFVKVINNYYDDEERKANELIAEERYSKVLSWCIFLLIMSMIYMIVHYRINSYKDKIKFNMEIASNLRSIISQKNSLIADQETESTKYDEKIKQMQQESEDIATRLSDSENNLKKLTEEKIKAENDARFIIRHLMTAQFNTLNLLCDEYYQYEGKKNKQARIYEKVIGIIDDFKSDEIISSLKESVNKNMNNLIDRFDKDFNQLGKADKDMFLYVVLDFSPQAISVLSGNAIGSIYNRKALLKKKIKQSTIANINDYLIFFD